MMNNGQQRVAPAKNLQGAFEAAVRDVYQVSLTGKASQYRTPIAQRTGNGSLGGAEKRALSDAANALAQLWNVSSVSHR